MRSRCVHAVLVTEDVLGDTTTEERADDLLETPPELFAHYAVDEGVDAAVEEATKMGHKHRKEEVAFVEEAAAVVVGGLDLAHDADPVLRRPCNDEGNCYHNDHPGNLKK